MWAKQQVVMPISSSWQQGLSGNGHKVEPMWYLRVVPVSLLWQAQSVSEDYLSLVVVSAPLSVCLIVSMNTFLHVSAKD